MSLEAFVRAAGGVMGRAREGFGAGGLACDCPLAPVPPSTPPAGQGAAIDAHQSAAATLDWLDAHGHQKQSDVRFR